jgi:AcrR family transcriptional regulator
MSFKNEKEVLTAALDEFSFKIYDKASLNTIIKKSGISKGSFYHHFKNKYDIYIYVLRESLTKKWEYINSEINKETAANTSNNIYNILSEQIKIGLRFGEKESNL